MDFNLVISLDVGVIAVDKYINITKSFKTLDHTVQSTKLRFYAVRGLAHKVLVNYISYRYQYVKYNGEL